MKKWFALALAAMMMLATLTGCGGTESGGTQQTQETDQGQSSSETDTVPGDSCEDRQSDHWYFDKRALQYPQPAYV